MTEIGLYLATPLLPAAEEFLPILEAALRVGAPASVLLRLAPQDEASALALIRAVAPRVQATGAALLIDGAPELAEKGEADGVHVSGVGGAFEAAMKRLSPGRIVGAGGLETRHDAMVAGEAGADYVAFGDWDAPLVADALIERVDWWAQLFTIPCVAYASSLSEVGPLVDAGVDFVMLGECIWSDPRGVEAALADVNAALAAAEES